MGPSPPHFSSVQSPLAFVSSVCAKDWAAQTPLPHLLTASSLQGQQVIEPRDEPQCEVQHRDVGILSLFPPHE
jgi:hypothetical protein